MTNDQFLLFPMLSYGYKNTVGAVACLLFSDPSLTPHANNVFVDVVNVENASICSLFQVTLRTMF